MPQVAVAAAAAAVSAGVGGLAAGAATSAIVSSMIASAALAAVSGAISMAMTDSPSVSPQPPNTLMKQPIPSGKVPYGRCRVGGDLCLMEDGQGADEGKLHLGMLVACCKIRGVLRIYDGDNLMWSESQGLTDDYQDKIERVVVMTGDDDQEAIPDLVADLPGSLDETFRLRGWAWVWIKLADLADHWAAGLPGLWCEVEGAEVYDPRSGTWGYSANWALCVADYLTRTRGGAGYPWSKLDEETVIVAANLCDESVPYRSKSGSYRKYELNGIIDTEIVPRRNLNAMMPYGLGKLIESNGKFRLYGGAYVNPQFTLEPRHFLSGAHMSGAVKHEEMIDGVRGYFANPEANYNEDDFGAVVFSDFSRPIEQARWMDMDLDRERDGERAQGIAVLSGRQQRRLWKIAASVSLSFMFVEAGDAGTVKLPHLGVDSPYEVVKSTLNLHPEQSSVSLDLLENDLSFWELAGETFTQAPTPASSTLPNPHVVQPPSGVTITPTTEQLADGTRVPTLVVEWTASPSRNRRGYYVRWTRPDGSDAQQFVRGTRAVIRGEVDPVSVSVVAVNHLGVPSRSVDAGTVNPPADTIAPSAPSDVSAIAGFERVGLFWTNPPEHDFHAVLVREASSASFGASSLVGSFAGDPGSPGFAERPGLAADAKRYYWLASKDRSRNVSAWVGPVSATPTRIDTHQLAFDAIPPELIADLSLTNRMFANGDLDGTKLRAASITGIQIGANEILAHHVAIADPENLIPDDDLLDAKAWRFADGWGLYSGSSIAFDSTGHLTVHVADIPTGGSARAWSKAFKVTPGEELYGELQLDAMGSTQGVWSLNFLRTDGSLLSQTHFGDLDTSGSQSLHVRSGSIVVPSGAHSAEVRIEVLENGSFATKRVGGVKIRRKLGGKLIVDGEILTHHLGANVVTADKMAVSELSAISANLGSIVVDRAHIGQLSVGYGELDYGAAHVAFQESDGSLRVLDTPGVQVIHSFTVERNGFLMFTYRLNISKLGGTEFGLARVRINGVTQDSWPVEGNISGLQRFDFSQILLPVVAGDVVDFTAETDQGAYEIEFSRMRVIVQQRT